MNVNLTTIAVHPKEKMRFIRGYHPSLQITLPD